MEYVEELKNKNPDHSNIIDPNFKPEDKDLVELLKKKFNSMDTNKSGKIRYNYLHSIYLSLLCIYI